MCWWWGKSDGNALNWLKLTERLYKLGKPISRTQMCGYSGQLKIGPLKTGNMLPGLLDYQFLLKDTDGRVRNWQQRPEPWWCSLHHGIMVHGVLPWHALGPAVSLRSGAADHGQVFMTTNYHLLGGVDDIEKKMCIWNACFHVKSRCHGFFYISAPC